MHVALVHSPDTSVIRFLLSEGANTTLRNSEGYAPIHSLAAFGRVAGHLAAYKAWGGDVGLALDADECSLPLRTCQTVPLHLVAARPGALELLIGFLAAGADIGKYDAKGRTALHLAARTSGVLAVEALLAAGAEIDATDFEGFTPLMLAAQRGADPVVPAQSDRALVNLLLDLGAEVDAENQQGLSAVMLAATYSDDPQIWSRLVEMTEDETLCAVDKKGRTVKALFDLNDRLDRDNAYWVVNQKCP